MHPLSIEDRPSSSIKRIARLGLITLLVVVAIIIGVSFNIYLATILISLVVVVRSMILVSQKVTAPRLIVSFIAVAIFATACFGVFLPSLIRS